MKRKKKIENSPSYGEIKEIITDLFYNSTIVHF